MASQRLEDVLLGEITKLRLENLNLNKEKTFLELLVDTDAKHAENITDKLFAKLDESKQDLLEMIDLQRNEVIVLHKECGKTELADTIDLGFPIGLEKNIIDFTNETKLALDPGDGVVLYSDGITEAENMDGVNYGLERLCHTVSSCWHLTSEAVKETVINDVRTHIGPQTVYDDLTLVVVKQQPEMVRKRYSVIIMKKPTVQPSDAVIVTTMVQLGVQVSRFAAGLSRIPSR